MTCASLFGIKGNCGLWLSIPPCIQTPYPNTVFTFAKPVNHSCTLSLSFANTHINPHTHTFHPPASKHTPCQSLPTQHKEFCHGISHPLLWACDVLCWISVLSLDISKGKICSEKVLRQIALNLPSAAVYHRTNTLTRLQPTADMQQEWHSVHGNYWLSKSDDFICNRPVFKPWVMCQHRWFSPEGKSRHEGDERREKKQKQVTVVTRIAIVQQPCGLISLCPKNPHEWGKGLLKYCASVCVPVGVTTQIRAKIYCSPNNQTNQTTRVSFSLNREVQGVLY